MRSLHRPISLFADQSYNAFVLIFMKTVAKFLTHTYVTVMHVYPCMCVFSVARNSNWLLAIFLQITLFSCILVGPNLAIGNRSKTLSDKLLTFIYTTSLCAFPCMHVCVYVRTYMHTIGDYKVAEMIGQKPLIAVMSLNLVGYPHID